MFVMSAFELLPALPMVTDGMYGIVLAGERGQIKESSLHRSEVALCSSSVALSRWRALA